jgi:hypothetical protein
MFERIVGASDVGFEACILSAEDLSNKMLRAYVHHHHHTRPLHASVAIISNQQLD